MTLDEFKQKLPQPPKGWGVSLSPRALVPEVLVASFVEHSTGSKVGFIALAKDDFILASMNHVGPEPSALTDDERRSLFLLPPLAKEEVLAPHDGAPDSVLDDAEVAVVTD